MAEGGDGYPRPIGEDYREDGESGTRLAEISCVVASARPLPVSSSLLLQRHPAPLVAVLPLPSCSFRRSGRVLELHESSTSERRSTPSEVSGPSPIHHVLVGVGNGYG
tara:strand:- start:4184 stop:4507 length:324 start_codon:yes stop_codon:yes gene_type:complete